MNITADMILLLLALYSLINVINRAYMVHVITYALTVLTSCH